MTTNLITRKNNKMQLNGNLLTGDTFDNKNYIKAYLDAKWDKESKGWIIDTKKLDNILSIANSIGLRINNNTEEQPQKTQRVSGYCNKCHSYCYGDCDSH